ncbi:MAG: GTPase Era [Firmicutes bacterium]|nr:GTPase Era [Bacillota bacterium]
MNKEQHEKKSGFVALIGRPNVGKSTLVNRLVGQKIAIMSSKPQTTRTQIRGVMNRDAGQAVLLDTPGLHKPKHLLGEYMVQSANSAIRDVDVLLMVADATDGHVDADELVVERLKQSPSPAILALNKVDAVAKETLLRKIALYQEMYPFKEIIPISAKTGDQIEVLERVLFSHLPTGPFYYPEGMLTDHPERFLIAELIREKVLLTTREEIPHSIAVSVEQMEKRGNTLYVSAVIYTERDSQKGILIGKGGELLKRVGTMARQDIEGLLETKAFLELWIKVKKDWRNAEHMLRTFGFERE